MMSVSALLRIYFYLLNILQQIEPAGRVQAFRWVWRLAWERSGNNNIWKIYLQDLRFHFQPGII